MLSQLTGSPLAQNGCKLRSTEMKCTLIAQVVNQITKMIRLPFRTSSNENDSRALPVLTGHVTCTATRQNPTHQCNSSLYIYIYTYCTICISQCEPFSVSNSYLELNVTKPTFSWRNNQSCESDPEAQNFSAAFLIFRVPNLTSPYQKHCHKQS